MITVKSNMPQEIELKDMRRNSTAILTGIPSNGVAGDLGSILFKTIDGQLFGVREVSIDSWGSNHTGYKCTPIDVKVEVNLATTDGSVFPAKILAEGP